MNGLPHTDEVKTHYVKREFMDEADKVNDLCNLPYIREIDRTGRIMDIVTTWNRERIKEKNKEGGGSDDGLKNGDSEDDNNNNGNDNNLNT